MPIKHGIDTHILQPPFLHNEIILILPVRVAWLEPLHSTYTAVHPGMCDLRDLVGPQGRQGVKVVVAAFPTLISVGVIDFR